MMQRVRRVRVFWSLSIADRLAVVEALALPICISLGFRLLGVPKTQTLLRWWALERKETKHPADFELRIRNARRAQRIVKRTTGIAGNCLVRSMTLWTMLRRRGLSTELRVGFRKCEGRIEGHAWVEYDSTPINEDARTIRTYVPYQQPANFDLWRRIGQKASEG
jgi:hypothetical protein